MISCYKRVDRRRVGFNEHGGEWGFYKGMRWKVGKKFGGRLHLKSERVP